MGFSMRESMHEQILGSYADPLFVYVRGSNGSFMRSSCRMRRVFCKKGCDCDGETWEECVEECNEICYKDPVLKDREWSAYIDRSPGADTYSLQCFHACVSGCGFKFDILSEKVDQVQPKRPPKPKPAVVPKPSATPVEHTTDSDDIPSTSA
ncbi:hypothetical protein QJS04_geneDACA001910 [Acorus gramineus]|uniref:Defensin-like protein n=1 Tax=Acorus gramineus TaxID=55184 RepID=A0AAV9A954_ACOGR|nr:hypothetical protein QJS04_geneDACA023776 [Acorus gramineus]KAK1260788.1 hypothetical protein QJS04_geneDACA001910 [Acorus gramineus]